MKAFIIFAFLFSTTVTAKPIFNAEDFSLLTIEQKVEVIKIYKDFLREASGNFETDKYSSYKFSFIEEAIASGSFDCFYAGWPSVSRPSGGKRLCTSPLNGNPDYSRMSSSCGANQLLCQPYIFGDGICVNVATRAQKNSAFKQCETRFAEEGRTLEAVARAIDTDEKRNKLNALLEDSEQICRSGLRTQAALCQRLRNKLLELKRGVEASQGQQLQRVAEVVEEVTTERAEPQVDCDPNTPGIQLEPPRTERVGQARTVRPVQPVQQVQTVQPPRVVSPRRQPTSEMRMLRCPAEELPATRIAPEEIQTFLAANNIHVVFGTATTEQLQNFIAEFNRFPQTIREEMKQKNSRIHLIVGQGVSQDPSWASEISRARAEDRNNWIVTPDGRQMSNIPGTGGSIFNPRAMNPTRIVVNRMNEGLTSLFLHEYAHTMDNMYGHHAITGSAGWRNALSSDLRSTEFLNEICANNYCTNPEHPEEGFAELFTYYHACPTTRRQMETLLPNVARFFSQLTSVRNYLGRR